MITLKGVDPKMIANNIEPSEPIHPGEVLKDEIEYRGISQRKLAEQIGISHESLYQKIGNERAFKATEIMRISEILGMSTSDRDEIFFATDVC